jgi:hypothetical protein
MPQPNAPSPLSQEMKNVRGIKQISRIKAAEFGIISIKNEKNGTMEGYRNKEDISTLAPNTLVVGSHDVLTNVFGRVYSRAGYTPDGASSGINVGIVSSYDWLTPPSGVVRNLRATMPNTGSGYMEVRNVDSTGKVTWNKLLTNLNSANFNFAPWWNNTQQINEVLMVNGGQQIWDWNGGIATLGTTTDTGSAIMSIATTPTAGGTGYVVGDVLTISGGTGGTVSVSSTTNGAITGISILSGGSSYAVNDVVAVGFGGGYGGTIKVTGASSGAMTSATIQTAGQGYTAGAGWAQTGSGAGNGAAEITISSVAGGVVASVALVTPGTGYTIGSGISTTGGTGTGATVQVISLGTNAITIQGSKTVGQLGFYNDANAHRLIINGQTFAYTSSTSAANSNSFLNVSPDPTTAGLTAGMLIIQAPEVTQNTGGSSGLPVNTGTTFTNWTNDLLCVANSQLFVGCLTNAAVYVSQQFSFTLFNGTNGAGGLPLNLPPAPVGMIVQEDVPYVSCGKGQWYVINYQKSADLSSFNWIPQPLKTGLRQGVYSQALMWKMPNDIAFVTNEPVVRTLGRVTAVIETPQMVNLSASIVNDIQTYNFAGGSGKFINENLYIALPAQGLIRIYNMTAQDEGKKNFYWEAPQNIPLSGFMDAGDGNIYGHSALTGDTYKLFTGSSDNGNQINAVAVFPQITFGDRHKLKSFLKEYVEGYLSQTTTLTCSLLFIGTNKSTTLTKQIMGTNTAITNNAAETASLGKVSLGKNPIGSDLIQSSQVVAPNFAVYLTFQRTPFFKVQPFFSSLGQSQSWQLLAYGTNQQTTSEQEVAITI